MDKIEKIFVLPAIHLPYSEPLEALLGHFFKESGEILPRPPWQSPSCARRMKVAKDGELLEGWTGLLTEDEKPAFVERRLLRLVNCWRANGRANGKANGKAIGKAG